MVYKQFTEEEKEDYKENKNNEKKEVLELFKKFLESKTIEEILGIVIKYKQMHNYSFANILFIYSQILKNGKFVGIINSYNNWKKEGFYVNKGEKALNVWYPIFFKKSTKSEEENQNEIEIESSEDTSIIEQNYIKAFGIGKVFDISQTNAFDNYLQNEKIIDEKIMKNSEINYDIATSFVCSNFKNLQITEDFKESDIKGYYEKDKITLHEKSSHTLFHEAGHHIVDILNLLNVKDKNSYAKNEVLAEVSAYLLMQKFNISEYNFNYSNVWASRLSESFTINEFEINFKKIEKYIDSLNLN